MILAERNLTELLSPVHYEGPATDHMDHNVVNMMVVFFVGFVLLAGCFFFFSRVYSACITPCNGRHTDVESATPPPPAMLQPTPRYRARILTMRSWFTRAAPTPTPDAQLSQGTIEVDQDNEKMKRDEEESEEALTQLSEIASKRGRRPSTISGETFVGEEEAEKKSLEDIPEISIITHPPPAHLV